MTTPPRSQPENRMNFRVRYNECDAMGVAHHGNYAAWFEMGRTELLRASGVRYRDLEEAGIYIVVVKLETRFRRPARYDDLLTLTTRVARISHAKIEHEYTLTRENETLAIGSTTLACVDRDGNITRVPEEIINPGL